MRRLNTALCDSTCSFATQNTRNELVMSSRKKNELVQYASRGLSKHRGSEESRVLFGGRGQPSVRPTLPPEHETRDTRHETRDMCQLYHQINRAHTRGKAGKMMVWKPGLYEGAAAARLTWRLKTQMEDERAEEAR